MPPPSFPSRQELTHAIELTEAQIEALRIWAQSCHNAILISRGIIAAGILSLAAGFAGVFVGHTANLVVFGIAATIGGLVWLGANKSSLKAASNELKINEMKRIELINQMPLRHVDGENGTLDG
jgi:hypothetical protein